MRAISFGLVAVLMFWGSATSDAQSPETRISEPSPPHATAIASGEFRDGDPVHRGSGQLKILKTPDGQTIVRLENLKIVPGPNLFVYLAKDEDPLFPEDVTVAFASLGILKERTGDQNYVVPAEIDLSEWGSVVVWCNTFKVQFAVATIERG